MTSEQFWEIIERCSPQSFDMCLKCRLLKEELSQMAPDDLRSFVDHYWLYKQQAYYWPLWDAASISYGGCGDDSFMDYRSSLITFGRQVFENALSDPDSLGDLEQLIPRSEEVFGVVHDAIQRVLPSEYRLPEKAPSEPGGITIEDDNDPESHARIRFPKLCALQDRMASPSRKKRWWKLW